MSIKSVHCEVLLKLDIAMAKALHLNFLIEIIVLAFIKQNQL